MSDHEPRIGEPGARRNYDLAATTSDNDPSLAEGAAGGYSVPGSVPSSPDNEEQPLGSPKGGAVSGGADTGPGRYGGAEPDAGAWNDPTIGGHQSGAEHPSAVRTGAGETPSTDRGDVMSAAQTRDAEHYEEHHEHHHAHPHEGQHEGPSGGASVGEWAGRQAQGQYGGSPSAGADQPDYSRAEDWRQQHGGGGGEVH